MSENLVFGRRREKEEIVVCKNACINPLNHFPAVRRLFLFIHSFIYRGLKHPDVYGEKTRFLVEPIRMHGKKISDLLLKQFTQTGQWVSECAAAPRSCWRGRRLHRQLADPRRPPRLRSQKERLIPSGPSPAFYLPPSRPATSRSEEQMPSPASTSRRWK